MKTTQKNSIDLSSTIAFLTRKVRIAAITGLICLIPLPVLAAPRIEVSPRLPENGKINLRVKVLNENNVPIEGLNTQDFQIRTTKINADASLNNFSSITRFNLIQPEQLPKLDPATIVILLDMSGSMGEPDKSGVKKLEGAINAITGFIQLVKEKKVPAKIAVVPFGESSDPRCAYDVSQKIIQKRLLDVTDPKLEDNVKRIAGSLPCAGTDLYAPLREAVEFLGDYENDVLPNSESSTEEIIPSRRSVILFSDGYHTHNYRYTEVQEFEDLVAVLKKNPQVKVNTLGYGESLEQLRDRSLIRNGNRNCDLRDEQLSEPDGIISLVRRCFLPGSDITRFIVDQPRLSEIADKTSGIREFPLNAKEAVKSLGKIFTSLREYEIKYAQPGADPADKYSVTVGVNSPTRQLNVISEPETVTIPNFAYHRLPLFPDRMLILLGTVALLGGTALGFKRWSQKLKEEADSWI